MASDKRTLSTNASREAVGEAEESSATVPGATATERPASEIPRPTEGYSDHEVVTEANVAYTQLTWSDGLASTSADHENEDEDYII